MVTRHTLTDTPDAPMPYAHIADQALWYTDGGGPAAPVLALHGFPLDQSQFDAIDAALGERIRLVRFDQRAAGDTRWDGRPFTLDDLADDALALLDHLGLDRAVAFGAGPGGQIALRIALRAPERVAGLMLLGVDAEAPDPLSVAGYTALRDAWLAVGPDRDLLEGMAAAWFGERHRRPALWSRWIARWQALSGAAIAAGIEALITRTDISRDLGRVRCPALVMHGALDGAVPVERGRDLADRLAGADSLVEIADAAHAATLTHPDEVVGAMVGFLQRPGASR